MINSKCLSTLIKILISHPHARCRGAMAPLPHAFVVSADSFFKNFKKVRTDLSQIVEFLEASRENRCEAGHKSGTNRARQKDGLATNRGIP